MRCKLVSGLVPLGLLNLVAASATAEQSFEPLYNAEDLLFLHHMIVHHEQALEMCDLVPSRTRREAFIRFAGYVKRAQAAEIEIMRSWLDLAAKRGLDVPRHPLHGDPPMDGMLSRAQMQALAAASGAQFERLWLEGMIYHHDGALVMSRDQQLQQLENGRRPYGLAVLVEDILIEQRAEIMKMRGWLRDWGLVSARGPAGSSAASSLTDADPRPHGAEHAGP